mgnify:CR=1 FL=1
MNEYDNNNEEMQEGILNKSKICRRSGRAVGSVVAASGTRVRGLGIRSPLPLVHGTVRPESATRSSYSSVRFLYLMGPFP